MQKAKTSVQKIIYFQKSDHKPITHQWSQIQWNTENSILLEKNQLYVPQIINFQNQLGGVN